MTGRIQYPCGEGFWVRGETNYRIGTARHQDQGIMEPANAPQRLSQISTIWTVLRQAQQGPTEVATTARQLLLQRYGGAVYRYLLAALHDPHAAADLTQEFALRLVRGDFHKVQPQRGRFRDYVKTVLFHLVRRHHRQQQARGPLVPPDSPPLRNLAAPPEDPERAFRENWREELLARTWEALAGAHPHFYEVLRCRAAHPHLTALQLAEHVAGQVGKPFTIDGLRQTLHRARNLFTALLLEEVAHSLDSPTAEEVVQELCALDLLAYCRPALVRQFARR